MSELADPSAEIRIAPEAMEIATTYLECSSISTTADILGIEKEKVSYFLNKREVKSFIDTIFLDQGYMSRHKLQDAVSTLIDKKFEELDEAELGSSKDIADLLLMAHKMRMEEIKAMKDENKVRGPSTQVNINNGPSGAFGENYQSLMGKLMTAE